MFKLITLCILGLTLGPSVLSYPVKNVFAVDLTNQSGGDLPNHGAADFLSASFQSLPDFAQGAFYAAPTTSATYQLAAKEYDPPLSQIVSAYDHTQNKAKDFLHVSDQESVKQ